MEFKELYNFAQEIISQREGDGKISAIVPVSELKRVLKANVLWLDDVNFHPVEPKDGDPLGHYECYSDTDSRWEEPDSWVALISYANHLNMCERRFVWCKEMMHIFDTVDGCVSTPDEYRGLLREIEMKPLEPSESYLTENLAKWMALLILCPKEQRDRMKAEHEAGQLSDYDVALAFRIPEVVVSSLFSEYYDTYHARFIVE
ncbi:MAG: hypothetical protein AAF559_12170 [Pseudomonadota bacterium]